MLPIWAGDIHFAVQMMTSSCTAMPNVLMREEGSRRKSVGACGDRVSPVCFSVENLVEQLQN